MSFHWQLLGFSRLYPRWQSRPRINMCFQFHALRLAELGCRYWAEFVESAANLADEPSRLQDGGPIAQSLLAMAVPCQLPPLSDLWTASLGSLPQTLLHTSFD